MQNVRSFLGLPSILFLLVAAQAHHARAATEVTNAEALRHSIGLAPYVSTNRLADIQIAVLDNGFSGFVPGRGQLPDSAEIVAGPQNAPAPTSHGLGMAQIAWAMTGKRPEGPKFYLVNANGFTNFKAAVDFVVRKRVDIVLYSQVWPFGSNFDGSGFINETVSRAIRSGAIWINAAGNFGGMVYGGSIPSQDLGDCLRFENHLDENDVSLTLSWTDFRASEAYNTDKDLDLLVFDSSNRLIGSSELIQRGEAPPASGESRLSSHAREAIRLRALDRGAYCARVRVQSRNFAPGDRFRVLLESEKPGAIELASPSRNQEIFPPADHPEAITVGELFPISSFGPTADGRIKPDVLMGDAVVSFSNAATVRGSSPAAALYAGAVALLKSHQPDLTAAQLLTQARALRPAAVRPNELQPASPTAWPPIPREVSELVPSGGRLMVHPNGHFVVLSPVDPLELPQFRSGRAFRRAPDDLLALDPYERRWLAIPRAQASLISAPLIEFRRMAEAPGLWRAPLPAELSSW